MNVRETENSIPDGWVSIIKTLASSVIHSKQIGLWGNIDILKTNYTVPDQQDKDFFLSAKQTLSPPALQPLVLHW